MSEWLTHWGARLILATRAVDHAYQRFGRIRSRLVVTLASDAVLDAYNNLAYGGTSRYRPDSTVFREHLFPWEENAIEQFFPPPPARLLIGGAGGGREAFALARRGYEVVAFEPSPALVATLADHQPPGLRIAVYRAAYEELPCLHAVREGAPAGHLETLGPFDGGIVGWASFSHLRTEAARLQTLRVLAGVTRGPVLVSFWSRPEASGSSCKPGRLQRLLPRRWGRQWGDGFEMGIGFYHWVSDSEIRALARQAGLTIGELNTVNDETNWPHAVLVSAS